MTEDKADLRKRIAELEERVEELENCKSSTGGSSGDLLDRYDTYVMDEVESVTDAHPRRLMELYEESGVVDSKKQKRRVKRLKKIEGE